MRLPYVIVILTILSSVSTWSQTSSYGALLLTTNAALVVLPGGNMTIATSAGIKQQGRGAIVLYGDLENHGTIVPGDGILLCTGASTQVMKGTRPITLNYWWFRKPTGSRVEIDNSMRIYQPLTVSTITLQIVHSSAHTVTLDRDLTIGANGRWIVATTGTVGRDHHVVVRGNAQVDGQWLMRPIANSADYRATVRFQTTATQQLMGSGTVRFYRVILDKGAKTNRVESWMSVGVSRLSAGSAMEFIAGTWQQRTGTLTFDDGVSTSYNETISAQGAIHILGDASMIIGQNGGGSSLILDGGELVVNTTGFVDIGSQSGNSLRYTNAGGSRFILTSGTVRIAGRFSRQTPTGTNTITYRQGGGTLIVGIQGHSSSSLGTFDIGAAGSVFDMSGATIILQNANSSTAAGRPADFLIAASGMYVTGGTVMFGTSATTSPQRFDYHVPAGALWDVEVRSSLATVYPYSTTSDLRIQGNFYNEGVWKGTVTRKGAPVTAAGIVFEGSGSSNQLVQSPGTTTVATLRMNRGGGSGIVIVEDDITVATQLDLQDGSNSNAQILALGAGANLWIQTTSTTGIVDGNATAPIRYIRTSTSSGRVIWQVAAGRTYYFPIGSAELGDVYAPAEVSVANGGSDGWIGVRTSRGQRADGAHLQLPVSAADFLRRYWSIANRTTTHPMQWRFYYQDHSAELSGSEASLLEAGRWRPIDEMPGGQWVGYAATVNTTANTFQLPLLDASLVRGDWTLANDIFPQIFYSRQTGLWSNSNSWTYSPDHNGPPVPTGVYPSAAQDSAVIGGGIAGIGDHRIQLDRNITLGGVAVGTSATNTGTFDMQNFVLSGDWFTIAEQSTLYIGSTAGIMAAPVAEGNVQTTYRVFATTANYGYNGTSSQITGTGLPATVASLIIQNTGPAGDNRVTLGHSLLVTGDLSVFAGEFDLTSAVVQGTASGAFTLSAGAAMRIGGANNFAAALPGFASYTLATTSTVEFYGATKTIDMPPNGGLGYGYLVISDAPIKYINTPLQVRRDVRINSGAFLWNNVGGDKFRVLGNVINNGQLCNDGVIEIGN